MSEALAPLSPNQYVAPAAAELRREQMDVLHNDHAVIDNDVAPLYPPEEIGLPAEPADGREVSIVGEVAVPGEDAEGQDAHMAILKVRDPKLNQVRYALLGLTVDEQGKARAAAARPVLIGTAETGLGTTLIGRGQDALPATALWGKQAAYSPDVSRKHLEFMVTTEGLVVRDTSTNGSRIKTRQADAIDERYVADHTLHAAERARLRGLLDEAGRFANRRPITRDTEVRDGMVDIRSRYTGDGGAEAIVVDSTKPEDAEAYQKLSDLFDSKIAKVRRFSGRALEEQDVLRAMYETVGETLEYDLKYVDTMADLIKQVTAKRSGNPNINLDKAHLKANLSLYLDDGKGVCRHMALAAGWLGSRAKDMGLLAGRTTAEVNQDNVDMAAHEWARYTAADGTVYIIDPAQHFFGKLTDTLHGNRWHYFREGEKQQYLQRLGGSVITRPTGEVYDWQKDGGI